MARTGKKAGKVAIVARRDGQRSRKSGATKSAKSGSRKANPTKLTPVRQKPSPALEAASFKAQLKAAQIREQATAEILRAVASAGGDAAYPLQVTVATTAKLFRASSVRIRLVKDGDWGGTFHVGRSSDAVQSAVPDAMARIGGRNLPGTVVFENRQIHIPDLDHIPREMADWPGLPPARAAGARVISGTPLRRGNEAIGVLIVHRDRPEPFTTEELALQQTLADQAVIAIENARLFNETKEALERQTATAEILRVIASSPSDVQPVFDTIASSALRLIGGFSTAVHLVIDDLVHLVAFTPTNPESDRILVAAHPRHRSEVAAVGLVEHGETVQIADSEATDAHVRQLGRARGWRSVTLTPLMNRGNFIGFIASTRRETGVLAEHHVQLLRTFADQAVIAIENARLFNETQEALERQTATADILKVIASSPSDVQPVFEAIATRANNLVGGFSATVFRFIDGMAHLMAFTPTTPAADETLKSRFPSPVDSFAPFQMARDGEVTQVPDTETLTGDILDIARARGFRSMLFAPLKNKGAAIGLIAVNRLQPGAFSDHHVQLLRTFADQAVIAIENVRLFDEVQARTRELSKSLDDLRAAQDRLVQTEKLASLGQLTAGIAHEIKNPLNFVNNFSALSVDLADELNDLIKSAGLANEQRNEIDQLTGLLKDNLGKIVQHGQRADSIVKNMLLHSREGAGEHRPADINALVEESLNLAYHGARAEKSDFNITLKRDLDPAAGMIDLYPQEITRVLLNLISNGFYATTKRREIDRNGFEPTLAATTRNLGARVEIRVRDNGTGIPTNVKEKIFNPFFTTKPAGEGTGLGLSMSHDIVVKQHGGTIDVQTEPGSFTEFIITLPRELAAQRSTGGRN